MYIGGPRRRQNRPSARGISTRQPRPPPSLADSNTTHDPPQCFSRIPRRTLRSPNRNTVCPHSVPLAYRRTPTYTGRRQRHGSRHAGASDSLAGSLCLIIPIQFTPVPYATRTVCVPVHTRPVKPLPPSRETRSSEYDLWALPYLFRRSTHYSHVSECSGDTSHKDTVRPPQDNRGSMCPQRT